jgi:glycosyltransferase involved in cell wall biosynthesis
MKNKKDIIFILLASDSIGGAEVNLSKIAKKYPNNILLFTTKGSGELSKYCCSKNINIIHLTTGFNYTKIFNFLKYYFKFKPSIIYSIGICNCLLLRFLKSVLPFKLIVGVRSNYSHNTFNHNIFNYIEKYTWTMVDHYISNSIAASHTLSTKCFIPSTLVSVIHNGFVHTDIHPVNEYSSRSISVVANLSPRKGHLEFLSTVKDLTDKYNDLHFFLIGKDYMNGEVQAKCSQMKLDKHVTFTGYVSNVYEYLSQSCMFVLPAKWGEGCPTSILEAMACALPVVAYSADGIPELLSSSNLPLLANPTKANLYVNIDYLLSNPTQMQKIGCANLNHLKTHFNDVSFLQNHLKIFNSLL